MTNRQSKSAVPPNPPLSAPTLIRIGKLDELLAYEHPNTTRNRGTKEVWTKNVPLILIHRDGSMIPVKKWLYKPHDDELVYHKKKNRWAQGSEHYNIGKSHIAHVYVAVLDPPETQTTPAIYNG